MKLSFLLSGLFLSLNLMSQVWGPVGNGIPWKPNPNENLRVDGLNLYYHTFNGAYSDTAQFLHWNDTIWTKIPVPNLECKPNRGGYTLSFEVFQGEIFLADYDRQTNIPYVKKYSGSNWVDITPQNTTGPIGFLKTATDLFFQESIHDSISGQLLYINLFKYSPNGLIPLPNLPSNVTLIDNIHEYNGDLIVNANYGGIAGTFRDSILKLSNGVWSLAFPTITNSQPTLSSHFFFFELNTELFIGSIGAPLKIYKPNGGTLNYIASSPYPVHYFNKNEIAVWKNKLYLTDGFTGWCNIYAFDGQHFSKNPFPMLNKLIFLSSNGKNLFGFTMDSVNAPMDNYVYRIDSTLSSKQMEFLSLKSELNIYPLPASEFIFMETQSQSGVYGLLDLNGRKVHEIKLERNAKKEIDVSHLPPGVYLLTNGIEFHKIIIR